MGISSTVPQPFCDSVMANPDSETSGLTSAAGSGMGSLALKVRCVYNDGVGGGGMEGLARGLHGDAVAVAHCSPVFPHNGVGSVQIEHFNFIS